MSMQAAISAYRHADGDYPGALSDDRRAYINLLWYLYKNRTFEDIAIWQKYREQHQLYRNIRSIYNPTKRLVSFYVAQTYPGVLSEDASQLPDGVQLAIPLSKDTDDKLKIAIAQYWQWSNWQSGNRLMVRYGGATGSCLVEQIDDVMRGKVSAAVRWPGLVDPEFLKLDDMSNVKAYALEYDAVDDEGKQYKYRKEVDKEEFRYYKDDSPYKYDWVESTVVDNVYGFVPAVWCKHIDEGDDYGSPAISGSIAKIDELNGIASHTHDQIDILIDSPGIIASSGHVGRIGETAANLKSAAQDEYSATSAVREKPTKRLLLKGPADTKWVTLTGNLQPSETIPHMEKLIAEIEHDFPELSMYQELRKMSQVTGPGAARMMGDVYSKVLEVQSNYDQQSIKLFQQAVAIAGFRYRENKEGWRLKTQQQAKFAQFNLESYAKGELNFDIMPRPLIPMTETDTIELQGKRFENAGKASEIGFNQDKVYEYAGITDPVERKKMLEARSSVDVTLDTEQ